MAKAEPKPLRSPTDKIMPSLTTFADELERARPKFFRLRVAHVSNRATKIAEDAREAGVISLELITLYREKNRSFEEACDNDVMHQYKRMRWSGRR